jgi:hypothetical protein
MQYSIQSHPNAIHDVSNDMTSTTEIYLSRQVFYPHGFNVDVTANKSKTQEYVTIMCPTAHDLSGHSNVLRLVQNEDIAIDDPVTIMVTVTPCPHIISDADDNG